MYTSIRDDQSAKFWLNPVALASNLGFSPSELRRIQRLVAENEIMPGRDGMKTFEAKPGERVKDVHFTEDALAVDLMDGRTIIVPLAWFPRLFNATDDQRRHWKISGAGFGIHWPEVDEDLSTEGLLRGAPAAPQLARNQI